MDVTFNKYMEAETIVFQTLLSNGYPKESIIMEGQLSNGHSADFLIVDINTGLTVMMIEVKSSGGYKNIPIKQLAFKALKRNCDEDLLSVKAIAAVVDIDKKSMEFIDFTKAIKNNNLDYAVTHYTLPPYESLVAGARQKAISEQRDNQEKKIAALKWLCWLILPLICVVLVLLDAFGIYTLSSLRLITIGSGAVIVLLPCFKEIKIGEITLKSIINREKEETKQ